MNRSMHEMYKTSNSRKNSEDEAERSSCNTANVPPMLTEVAMQKIDENVALPSDNQNIFNENEMNNSPKDNGVTSGSHTPNINSTSERPGFNQLKKSSKKEGSSSRSKEIGKKTSVKDVLSDDSGTNDLVCMILRGRIHYEFGLRIYTTYTVFAKHSIRKPGFSDAGLKKWLVGLRSK